MATPSDRIGRMEGAFPARVDGVFIATTALAQRLDLLRHLIEFSDLLLLVAGPRGAGKSAFIAELLREPGERWRVCEVAAADGADADALLELILAGYGLRCGHHDNREQRVRLLETHLENQQRHGLVSLIVIDAVERLSAEALAMARDLAGRFEGVRPRLLLAGDSDVLVPLAAPESPSATFTHLLELPPFSPAEAFSYVQARLKAAGLPADTLPEARLRDSLAALPLFPGQINAVLREQAARLAPRPESPGRTAGRSRRPGWRPVLMVVGAAIALTLLLYPAPEEPTPPVEAPAAIESAPATVAVETTAVSATDLAEQVVSELPGRAAADTVAEVAEAGGESAVPVVDPIAAPAVPPTTAAEAPPGPPDTSAATDEVTLSALPVTAVPRDVPEPPPVLPPVPGPPVSGDAVARTSTVKPAVGIVADAGSPAVDASLAGGSGETSAPADANQATTGVVPAPVPKPASLPAATTPADGSVENSGGTGTQTQGVQAVAGAARAMTTADAEPSVDATPPPAVDAGDTTTPASGAQGATAGAPVTPSAQDSTPAAGAEAEAKPPAATATVVAPAQPPSPAGGTLAWLRAQPRGNFTIQLTGSQNLAAAERFVRRYRLSGRAVVVRTRRGSADWFIVVNGSYASRDAARAAIGRLDAALRRDSPWLRPIAEVLSLAVP